jgi:outer membrane murein-binding lipoprotein Lpp
MKKITTLILVSGIICMAGCCPYKQTVKDTATLVSNEGGLAQRDINDCKAGNTAKCDDATTKVKTITDVVNKLSDKINQ